MKTFTIILFIFFVFFSSISLASTESFTFFLMIFLAFIISLACLFAYLGKIRGFIMALILLIMPFLLEYLLFKYKMPFFKTAIFKTIDFKQLLSSITLANLFAIFTIPLLFICAIFFGQKIRLLAAIKTYHKTFLVIFACLLIALNFLAISPEKINIADSAKWLLIAFIILGLSAWLIKFKPKCPELFKELPIIIFLVIYGLTALKSSNTFNLLMVSLLTSYYLWLLYYEHKIRKISHAF